MPRLILAAVLLTAGVFSGCAPVNRCITRTFYVNRSFQKAGSVARIEHRTFAFRSDDLAKARFWGPATSGKVQAYYHAGLEKQADRIARDLDILLGAAREITGFEPVYGVRLYLFRVDDRPKNVRFWLDVERRERTFCAPIFIENGKDIYEDGLWPFPAHPFGILHEIVEMSLIDQDRISPVLPDLKWRIFGFPNYTRWFREGFASYSGQVACEKARQIWDLSVYDERSGWGAFEGPCFSSLSLLGGDLLKWHHSSGQGMDRLGYPASLGLFLLVRERFGEEAIRQIVQRVNQLKWADGKAIARVFEEVVGKSPAALAEELAWPHFAMKTASLSPAAALNRGLVSHPGRLVLKVDEGGAAAKAGIQPGDVITIANGRAVRTAFDFESAVFDAMPDGEVVLEIERLREMLQVKIALADVERITRKNRLALMREAMRKSDTWQWRGHFGWYLYKLRPKRRGQNDKGRADDKVPAGASP